MSHETRQGAVEEPEGDASAGATGDIYAGGDDESEITHPRLRAVRGLAPYVDGSAVAAELDDAQIVDSRPETVELGEDVVAAGEPNVAIETTAVVPDRAAAEATEVADEAGLEVAAVEGDDARHDVEGVAPALVAHEAGEMHEAESGAGDTVEPHIAESHRAVSPVSNAMAHEAPGVELDHHVAAEADDGDASPALAHYAEASAGGDAEAVERDGNGTGEGERTFAALGMDGPVDGPASTAETIAEPVAYAQSAAYGEKAEPTRPARHAPAVEDAAVPAGSTPPMAPQRAPGAPIPSLPRAKSRPAPQGGTPNGESAARPTGRRSRPPKVDVSGGHSKVPRDYWLDEDPLEEMRLSLGLRGARPITREAGKPLPKPSRFKRAPMWQSFLVMMAVLVVVALCVGGMVAFAASTLQQRPAQTTPVPAGTSSPAPATQSPAR